MFWQTVLADFSTHHSSALLLQKERIDYSGLLGAVTLELIAKQRDAANELIRMYETHRRPEARQRLFAR